MRIRIHRGTAEIGGNCVEIEAGDGQRVIIDLGRPLWASSAVDVPLPDAEGLTHHDPMLCGIVISHPHLDHYGLLGKVSADVPVFIGAEASSLLRAASFFSPVSVAIKPAGYHVHGESSTVGPFTITPYLNDHSAFDAYSLLIQCDGRRVFYTGDIRGHGRKSRLFEALLADPPRDVDVMLMEGTHVRSDPATDGETFETEADLEMRFVDVLKATSGAVAVLGSAQNIDRLVTVYRAARRSGRQLVVDLYGISVAAATRSTIPQLGFPDLRVYVPQRQRVLVKDSGEFNRVKELGQARVYAEELAAAPSRYVFYVPSSVVFELCRSGVLDSTGAVVWSLWSGYLRDGSGERLQQFLAERSIPLSTIHTSGHASVVDLQRLVGAVRPDRLVPMHSGASSRFVELFPNVERHDDGEWWDV
ncbi:MAG: MBL fold metallo-hydrolase [Actinomycetota bacterium]|nr:MBL fold metallo-hydrolase [Actinomycetota bacterium]